MRELIKFRVFIPAFIFFTLFFILNKSGHVNSLLAESLMFLCTFVAAYSMLGVLILFFSDNSNGKRK